MGTIDARTKWPEGWLTPKMAKKELKSTVGAIVFRRTNVWEDVHVRDDNPYSP